MRDTNAPLPVRPVENNEFAGARDRFPVHAFGRYHRHALPDLLAARAGLVAEDLSGVGALALAADGEVFCYRPTRHGVDVRPGDDGAETLVEFEDGTFSDFVNEIHSVSGLALARKLAFPRGTLAHLHRFEPALRALYSGRPIWTPQAASKLIDEAGRSLDLGRTFTLEDSDEALRRFLVTAGFVHVKGAFAASEIAAIGGEIERVRAALEPGTGDCWWSTTTGGEQVVTRINYLDRWSDALRDVGNDPRIARLGRLLGSHFRYCDDRLDGPMAFIKHSNVAQGLGNLQWHQDDGLGGHPILCPLMQVGIQLDPANAENGQLMILAGSHEYSKHPLAWGEEAGKPVVRIVTEPGDVTVHYGDVFHSTPPPTGLRAGRRVLYLKFAEPKTFEVIPAGAHYNDLLFKPGADDRVATRASTWGKDDTQERFEGRASGSD